MKDHKKKKKKSNKIGKNDSRKERKEENAGITPQHPTQPSTESGSRAQDNGSKIRSALGLTATVESKFETINLPNPYAELCLEGNSETDSLIKLARHTFKKLSSKEDTKKWRPTPIQLQSWPILKYNSEKKSASAAKKTNLIAIATTGSGKTLSYAVPMIDSCSGVQGKNSRRYIHGLVIVPTRELALQVSKTLKAVTKSANKLSGKEDKIQAVAIYGGVNREEQIDALSKNSQFIVAATPLRLIDLLGIGEVDGSGKKSVPNEKIQGLFESMRFLVIDEADQMATKSDMSQQVDLILDFLRNKCTQLERQCLFSATLPKRAMAKCNDWIDLPRVTVKVDTVTVGQAMKEAGDPSSENTKRSSERAGPLDLSTIPSHITQTLHVCATHKKPKKLMTTINKIRKEEKEKGNRRRRGLLIIFFGRIKTLQYVHGLLQKEQIQGVALHSQMNQNKREAQLNLFRSGKCPILLATDVAARGIHVKNVEYVINYDFPGSLEQYVHRCGRAGRSKVSGRAGESKAEDTSNATVYSFFHRELAPMAKDMVDLLRSCNAWVDPNLVALIPGGDKQGGGESKRKKRKLNKLKAAESDAVDKSGQKSPKKAKPSEAKVPAAKASNVDDDMGMGSEDEFPDLAPNRIVLKRASHVSMSDSDSDDDT